MFQKHFRTPISTYTQSSERSIKSATEERTLNFTSFLLFNNFTYDFKKKMHVQILQMIFSFHYPFSIEVTYMSHVYVFSKDSNENMCGIVGTHNFTCNDRSSHL